LSSLKVSSFLLPSLLSSKSLKASSFLLALSIRSGNFYHVPANFAFLLQSFHWSDIQISSNSEIPWLCRFRRSATPGFYRLDLCRPPDGKVYYRLCRFSLSATPGSAVFAYRRLLALPISPIRDSGFYRLDLLRPPYDFPHGGLVSRTSMDGSREKLPRAQTMSVFIYKCR
ncbi:unnamed protein product, partial [Linum tenue]